MDRERHFPEARNIFDSDIYFRKFLQLADKNPTLSEKELLHSIPNAGELFMAMGQDIEVMLSTQEIIRTFISSKDLLEDLDSKYQHETAYNYLSLLWERAVKSPIIGTLKKITYQEFLATPYWKTIAGEVKKRAGWKCKLCNSRGMLNAHHRDYTIRGKELDHMEDLICLCQSCHGKFHNIQEARR